MLWVVAAVKVVQDGDGVRGFVQPSADSHTDMGCVPGGEGVTKEERLVLAEGRRMPSFS